MSDAPHLGGFMPGGDPYTHTPDIWEDVLGLHPVKSVLDVGAGEGRNMAWFRDRGLRVLGVEGHTGACEAIRGAGMEAVEHDYVRGPLAVDGEFDLCVCTEFAEHVEQQYEDNWLRTVASARLVLFCHALPGQSGYHHVNCQPQEYWVRRFGDWGYELLEGPTARYQATGDPGKYGRRTMMLFRRREA